MTTTNTEAAGVLKRCPFCNAELVSNTNKEDLYVHRYGAYHEHPLGDCILDGFEVSPSNIASFNRRADTSASALARDEASVQDGYAFRSDGKLWVVTDPDVAMKWQEQGFEVTPVTATTTAGAQDERAVLEEAAVLCFEMSQKYPLETMSALQEAAGIIRTRLRKGSLKVALDYINRAASSATAPLTSDSEAAVDAFLAEVRAELIRARAKFPGDRIMTIALAEEFGELCKAVLDECSANVRKEAVQTAVMCARVVLDGDGSVNDWRAERGLDPLVEVAHD
ncbi:hypothetical protein [Paraburkholderia caledonica]|uniref:Uncharacterized protein n=1 Tax=Paraburkholderia caledonica TaxID=134536 RepID=A0AB73IP28_9BURK|nr:hypothetical protein [Paraburkholderia caledonica]